MEEKKRGPVEKKRAMDPVLKVEKAICHRLLLNGKSMTQGDEEEKKAKAMYHAVEFKEKLESHESATVLSMICKSKAKKDVYMNCWLFENQQTAAHWLAEQPTQQRNYAVWSIPAIPSTLDSTLTCPTSSVQGTWGCQHSTLQAQFATSGS